MSVKNYFSGVEGTQHFNAATSAGAQHCLMSYLYIKDTGVAILKQRVKETGVKFMIDSGAHTLQTNAHNPKSPQAGWKLADYERYLMEYVNWLKANRSLYEVAVELDISYPLNIAAGRKGEDAYGHQIVERWRRTVFAPLQDIGINIIYVWHGANGVQGWEQMCQEYPYVGLPGEKSGEPDFNKYIAAARRYSTPIHGFAATKQSDFRDWPWYSIDSTSWKSSERYGTLIVWNESQQRLRYYEDKADRAQFKTLFEKLGFKADAIIRDTDYREVTRFALWSFSEMEKFYQRRFKDRIFYYDLRLPQPAVLAKWDDKQVFKQWMKFEPDRVFTIHGKEADPARLRKYLLAISTVQNRKLGYLNNEPLARDFLQSYFAAQLAKNPVDIVAFQQEMSTFTAPKNKQADVRRSLDDYLPVNNPPKTRERIEYQLDDLQSDPSDSVQFGRC